MSQTSMWVFLLASTPKLLRLFIAYLEATGLFGKVERQWNNFCKESKALCISAETAKKLSDPSVLGQVTLLTDLERERFLQSLFSPIPAKEHTAGEQICLRDIFH